MKIGFYPGSFNPWHEGHQDVLAKALKVFDKIVILQLSNSAKGTPEELTPVSIENGVQLKNKGKIEILKRQDASLFAVAGTYVLGHHPGNEFGIIRGLRNEKDFCDEQILQYCYEDMGIKMPVFFIISDRQLVHYSSSMIKEMNKYAEKL
jgi:pantetheine-phosphate adenylyltransferase